MNVRHALLFLFLSGTIQLVAQVISTSYADPSAWFVLPDSNEINDTGPGADIFFVHPTTYFRQDPPNQERISQAEWRRLEHIKWNQLSAFEDLGRSFMPIYSQAGLPIFLKGDTSGLRSALDVAYGDVRNAFQHYLDNWNHGKPIILASHSQGSYLALRLIEEFFGGNRYKQLVVAYIVGIPISEEHFQSFDSVRFCQGPDQTGCIAGWMTIDGKTGIAKPRDKSYSFIGDQMIPSSELKLLSTNPVSWRSDSSTVSAKPGQILHPKLGAATERFSSKTAVAKIDGGFVRIYGHGRGEFNGPLGSLHVYDYNLFHGNIRENAKHRLKIFLMD
ncbi:MAG: DUF3089 domain-containing protein [Flavobacteriales bacterium]|nr:DUF3089 domain-containing protein [Flavobacteriales bacterium]